MSNVVAPCSRPYVRPSTPEDVVRLAQGMRREDVLEIHYASLYQPLEALAFSKEISPDCLTVAWGEKIVAMFGCASAGTLGVPWMMASDDLKRIQKSFLREARGYFQAMQDKYGYLTNYVWAQNTVHIKWLRWMGVQFDPPAPYGPCGELFIRFHKGEPCVIQYPQ